MSRTDGHPVRSVFKALASL